MYMYMHVFGTLYMYKRVNVVIYVLQGFGPLVWVSSVR